MVKLIRQIYGLLKLRRRFKNLFNANHSKAVLISYTIFPFFKGRRALHTNHQESIAIAQLFDELGYRVDVVHYTSTRPIDYSRYDVIFGFGIPFENSFGCNMKLKRIYYATGAQVFFQNHAEIGRVLEFNAKYGCNLTPKRVVPWTWSQSTTMSDALVVIGNQWTKSTYAPYTKSPLFAINATAFVNKRTLDIHRNTTVTRNSFLWFGSSGLIHKGLDLCLEYFSTHPNLTLHVCGPIEEDFFNVMKNELSRTNINFHDFVDVQSELFVKIVSQCSFALLPTCSEGQATALLTAMGSGLIPIATRNSGVGIDECGFFIDKLNASSLAASMDKVACLSEIDIENLSILSQKIIGENHTIERFKSRLHHILISGVMQ